MSFCHYASVEKQKKTKKMKKVMIFLLLVLPVLGFGQIEKGDWMFGGSAFFSSQKYDGANDRVTVFEIAPNVGYFITKNIALGADLSFFRVGKGDIWLEASPFARYYYKHVFVQAKYLTKNVGSYSNTGFDVSLGHAFFLKPNVAFEPELYFRKLRGAAAHSDYGLRLGVQFYW